MVLAITLMILDKRFAAVDQVRSVLSLSIAPLQYMVSWPINLIDNVGQMISSHDALIKQNLDLKTEELILKAQVQRLLAIESENNQLKKLLQSSKQIQGKTEIGQLLAIDSDPLVHQVIIDKGIHDNVYVGQPVLDAFGVIGQIIQVGPLNSRILLINDPKSGIPVQNVRNLIRAIAVGDGATGQLRLMNVTQTTDIRMGDMFVTSGLGQNYPEGYPVGHVVNITQEPGMAFVTVKLMPSAHLNQGRQVLLIWPNKHLNEVGHAQ